MCPLYSNEFESNVYPFTFVNWKVLAIIYSSMFSFIKSYAYNKTGWDATDCDFHSILFTNPNHILMRHEFHGNKFVR